MTIMALGAAEFRELVALLACGLGSALITRSRKIKLPLVRYYITSIHFWLMNHSSRTSTTRLMKSTSLRWIVEEIYDSKIPPRQFLISTLGICTSSARKLVTKRPKVGKPGTFIRVRELCLSSICNAIPMNNMETECWVS